VYEDPMSTDRGQPGGAEDYYTDPKKQIHSPFKPNINANGANTHQSPLDQNKLKKIVSGSKTNNMITEGYKEVGAKTAVDQVHNQDFLDQALSKAKTVAKTGYFHSNDNIVLMFRSMEVFCSKDDANSAKNAKSSPIYIPVDLVAKLYRFNTKDLLKTLFEHINFTSSGSINLDYPKLKIALDSSSKLFIAKNEFCTPESGVIRTSYMYQDLDYTVTIKYPYLEYHNNYKNVVVARPLITEDDFKLFFKSAVLLSTNWPMLALKCFTNYTQFNLLISGKRLNQVNSPVKFTKKMVMQQELEDSKPNASTSKYILDCKTG
jgi:hypothetical protein